uniref:Serine/threonine-protein kinase TOR n=1 Tax=Setaria digitata TaxID=48799 RepID=A0A915Q5B5_9BILA
MDSNIRDTSARIVASDFLIRLRRKGSDENRLKVARQLYDYINGELRDNSDQFIAEFFATFDAKVDQSALHMLMTSMDNDERKAGIILIVCLVENAGDETKRVPRFAKYLLKALMQGDEAGMKLAARAIAYLIQTSKTFAAELVEKSINQVCEWLEESERYESRRLAAVFLARQLALYTSTSFFLRASNFFSNIFKVIKDSKVTIRIAATKALHAALTVTSQREARQKSEWYWHCYDEAMNCLKFDGLSRDERQHPMLLILNELLRIGNAPAERQRILALGRQPQQNVRTVIGSNAIDWLTEHTYSVTVDSRTANQLVAEKFNDIYRVCNLASTSRYVCCQTTLLEIFPRLSSFGKTQTVASNEAVIFNVDIVSMFNHALNLTAKYSPAFFTIGLLVLDRPTELLPKLSRLFAVIQLQLQTATSKHRSVDEYVFLCLTLIIRALKEKIESDIKTLFPILLSTGLSKGLTDVAYEIIQSIPGLKTEAQDGLLKELCQLLMNRKLPSKLDPPTEPPMPAGPVNVTNVALTNLALATLGRFEFQRHALQMFINYIAHGYLSSDCTEVRLAAVDCCAKMLTPFVRVFESFECANKKQRFDVLNLIQSVLRQLVMVAVVDPSVEVRLRVLQCFKDGDPLLLSHLAQADMLDSIFMTLHDERLEMQEHAVALLGKLGSLNPAYVLPSLRNVLLETLTQLTNSGVPRLEEHSSRVISQVAKQSPKFIKPYMNPILAALVPKLSCEISRVDVTVQVLNAISELAVAGGADLVFSVETLFPSLVQFLQDSSSLSRREAALRTMGQLCQNTAYVVDPYKEHPELLDVLLRLLRTEMSVSMRRMTMRVLGIIGALDPYTHKVFTGKVSSQKSNSLALSLPATSLSSDMRNDTIQWFHYEKCTLAELYPAFSIASLAQMLEDDTLSHLHRDITQALLTIFSSLGPSCTLYVSKVIPRLIEVTQTAVRPELKQFYLQQLANFIALAGGSMKPFMSKLFSLVREAWSEDASMRLTVVNVMHQIGAAFGASFAPYIPELCPYLLSIVQSDRTKDRAITCAVFMCVQSIAMCLAPHIHLVLPPILLVLDDRTVKVEVRRIALDTVHQMAETICIRDHAPRIMQVWLRVISVHALQQKLLRLLVVIVRQMWKQFLVFRKSVDCALARHGLQCDEYLKLTIQLDEGSAAFPSHPLTVKISPNQVKQFVTSARHEKGQRINFDVLKRTWTTTQLVSKEDWGQWLVLLRIQFIRQSPSAALRACAPLADVHVSLAKDLFNAAFMSVWTDLDEMQQKDLETNLKFALDSNHTDIIQTILNLAEFMDHSEKGPLPVGSERLCKCAEQTRAYAKALRYTELNIREKFNKDPDPEHCRFLITYANKLNAQEEAAGIVAFARQHNMEIGRQGRWYEKLNEWEKALEIYNSETCITDELYEHQMRCLEALGQWDELNDLGKKAFAEVSAATNAIRRQNMAISAARGSWAVGDWETMDYYVKQVNENNQDGSFLRAVLAIRSEQYDDAMAYIEKVRDMCDAELTAMASESYERAYGAMTLVQQLTELEEAIEYKIWPDRRIRIAVVWSRRLQGCRPNIEQWQKLLLVKSLVLSRSEMRPLWIKFSSLCRQYGKLSMSRRILADLLGLKRTEELHKYIRNAGQPVRDGKGLLFSELMLMGLVAKCCLKLGDWYDTLPPPAKDVQQSVSPVSIPQQSSVNPPIMISVSPLLLTSNHVQIPPPAILAPSPHVLPPLQPSPPQPTLTQTMKFYTDATTYDPTWYKAWHKLASAYFNAAMYQTQNSFSPAPPPPPFIGAMPSTPSYGPFGSIMSQDTSSDILIAQLHPPPPPPAPVIVNPPSPAPNQAMIFLAKQAVSSFIKAITLAEGSRLEDTLRFLTLWFKHGDQVEVFETIRESLKLLPVEMWLEVIPQLMARLDSKQNVAQLIKQVVIDLSKVHPQSLVYALTVAAKSANSRRSAVATEILAIMSDSQPTLVEQAKLVSDELIRCAILWHEQWHEALDDASRLYFQDKNVKAMFELLDPLHEMIERGATTLKEQSFKQTYENELKEAWNACRCYLRSQNAKELNQAWDLYYIVFRKISSQLRQLTSLDLNYVSPRLMLTEKPKAVCYEKYMLEQRLVKARDLELAVPGTYDPNAPLVTISSINNTLQVINSKQRPRKVIMKGSDGKDYIFLLKGHEDPRQDERVMQLFGLVNTLLLHQGDTSRRNLTIQRYSIIALSQNSGLIGWVPNCDTLHSLIRDYRERKGILLSMEHKIMQNFANDLDQMTLLQKVQVFQHALEMTSGNDLQQILWLKSPNSEIWFDRRTNYTRSMACMSMVGYILGLGDRHPSNLMLDRVSGKIVHIDFGDCFEVAMTREKFPEKIPFRLTRMLIQAMEATGIEGNYRITCERVLRVLRSNKESLLAVLEAFVYDPLINWRLMEAGGRRPPPETLQKDGQTDSKAESSLRRIKQKLAGNKFVIPVVEGRDFNPNVEFSVPEQVGRLIDQAILAENLCQCYIGWCPFW